MTLKKLKTKVYRRVFRWMWRHHWSPPYPSHDQQIARILRDMDRIERGGKWS